MRKHFLTLIPALAFFCFSCYHSPEVRYGEAPTEEVVEFVSTVSSGNSKGILTPFNFEDSIRNLYDKINLQSYNLDYSIFRLGMVGYYSLQYEGALNEKGIITIIDFAKPSTDKRFYTIDLKEQVLKFHSYVAHGMNSGENIATAFSNKLNSNQSSMGFYVTGETYVGSKGYSLRLDGKDGDYNDKIHSRGVVIHEADYVSESWIQRYGRLGRSQGCPALPTEISCEVIDTIKGNTAIFAYYPDENYLRSSRHLKVESLMNILEKNAVQFVGTMSGAQS